MNGKGSAVGRTAPTPPGALGIHAQRAGLSRRVRSGRALGVAAISGPDLPEGASAVSPPVGREEPIGVDAPRRRGAVLAGARWMTISQTAAVVTQVGTSLVLARLLSPAESRAVGHVAAEVAKAAAGLSTDGHGALIVLERETGLEEVAETGVMIHGDVSADLLRTIFAPRTALHDGAVVIRGESIIAAGATLLQAYTGFIYGGPLWPRRVVRGLGPR